MDLYDFSERYLERQTLSYFPTFNLHELVWYNDSNLYAWPPFFTVMRGHENLNDLMKMFAMILQNRYNLPNIIKFRFGNYAHLTTATHGFDVSYLVKITPADLYADLNMLVGFGTSSTWNKYCNGLIDAANYLNVYSNYHNYDTHIRTYLAGHRENYLINELCTITGIGPALARNYLKEIGYLSFGKPDLHLMPIFQSFDPTVIDYTTFDASLRVQSVKCGVSPYVLDRTLWLICSGDYFIHTKKITAGRRSLRPNFITELTRAIASGVVIV